MNNKILKFFKLDTIFSEINQLKQKIDSTIAEYENLKEQIASLNSAVISLAKAAEIHQKSIRDLAITQVALLNTNKSSSVDTSLPSTKPKVEKPN